MVVFPVPGPPEITEIRRVKATAAATFCQSVASSEENSASSVCRSCVSSQGSGALVSLKKRATVSSLRHSRLRYKRSPTRIIGVPVSAPLTAGEPRSIACQSTASPSSAKHACKAGGIFSSTARRDSGRHTCPSPASLLRMAAASMTAGSSPATIMANCTSRWRSNRCSTASSSSACIVMPSPPCLRQTGYPFFQSAPQPDAC